MVQLRKQNLSIYLQIKVNFKTKKFSYHRRAHTK